MTDKQELIAVEPDLTMADAILAKINGNWKWKQRYDFLATLRDDAEGFTRFMHIICFMEESSLKEYTDGVTINEDNLSEGIPSSTRVATELKDQAVKSLKSTVMAAIRFTYRLPVVHRLAVRLSTGVNLIDARELAEDAIMELETQNELWMIELLKEVLGKRSKSVSDEETKLLKLIDIKRSVNKSGWPTAIQEAGFELPSDSGDRGRAIARIKNRAIRDAAAQGKPIELDGKPGRTKK